MKWSKIPERETVRRKQTDTISSVQKVIKKWQLTGTVEVGIRSGRPRAASERAVGGTGRKGARTTSGCRRPPEGGQTSAAGLFPPCKPFPGHRTNQWWTAEKRTPPKNNNKQNKLSRLDFRRTMMRRPTKTILGIWMRKESCKSGGCVWLKPDLDVLETPETNNTRLLCLLSSLTHTAKQQVWINPPQLHPGRFFSTWPKHSTVRPNLLGVNTVEFN